MKHTMPTMLLIKVYISMKDDTKKVAYIVTNTSKEMKSAESYDFNAADHNFESINDLCEKFFGTKGYKYIEERINEALAYEMDMNTVKFFVIAEVVETDYINTRVIDIQTFKESSKKESLKNLKENGSLVKKEEETPSE